jgi:SAM-dependent methyltransferase
MSTDETWEYFGKNDPYYGVVSLPEFAAERLTDEGRQRFFETGQKYVELVLSVVRDRLDSKFQPTRALDFGCGVGRLLIPLAKLCTSAVGVDVSSPMLDEARTNCAQAGLSNVELVKGDDKLSALNGTFDFINSFIVFQHIPPARGERIFRNLLSHLRDGGIGAVQFSYGFGSSTPRGRKLLVKAYRKVPMLWSVRNVAKGRPLSEPMMQMNEYDLNRLLRILQESGCHLVHVRFTETGLFGHGFYGVILFFKKTALDLGTHA